MTRPEALRMTIKTSNCEELIAYCKRELEKIEEKEKKRKKKIRESEKGLEQARLTQRICEFLDERGDWVQVGEIGEFLGEGLSRQKVTSLCTELVREGIVESDTHRFKEKGERKVYRIIK